MTDCFSLRRYQQSVINKMKWSMGLDGNDVVVAPTGSGKSVIIAHFAKEIDQDVLILQPSKELVEQNVEKLLQYVDKDEVGIYSASVGQKEIRRYTFATIGSIYKKPEQFAHFKVVLLDECHLHNTEDRGTMYNSFLRTIGNPKVYGLTATPFRMGVRYEKYGTWKYAIETIHVTRLITRTKDRFWKRMLAVINPKDIERYLSFPEYVDLSTVEHENIPTNKSASDFDLDAFEEMVGNIPIALEQAKRHKSVLVFCSSVLQAETLAKAVNGAVVSSKTPKKERAEIVKNFKSGSIQYVFNVGIFTTGFDYPELEAIVLIRPTRSIGLYMQMIGRLFRPSEKIKWVYDVSGTVKELGRADSLEIKKVETKWDITTETGVWHNQELYRFKLKPKKPTWFNFDSRTDG
jgi:DNA repair protein RadD